MKKILLAFQFLTIIPLKVNGDISEKELSRSASFFPLVGAFQGLLAAVSAALLLKVFSAEIVSALVVLILIISNGGFHLDGLADTFDALAVKSSGDKAVDRERRLSAMKDSSTGAIGVVAITMTLLLKFLFLDHILKDYSPFTAYYPLFFMPVFSKWAMNVAIFHGASARQDGLGRIFIKNKSGKELLFTTMVVVFLFAVLSFMHSLSGFLPFMLFLLFATFVLSFSSTKFFGKKFGGLTGDTLGAISEITETIFLLMAVAWSRLYI
ncbi:MAG: adenosylcobinamide-GDP ribazoletransferase [Nitrospirota bacterium]